MLQSLCNKVASLLCWSLFLIKLPLGLQVYQKEIEICEIFKNTYFEEPPVAASARSLVSSVTPIFLKILDILKHY